MIVVDTSAVLAVLLNEPGKDIVAAQMEQDDAALLSCVNVAEVIGVMIRKTRLSFSESVGALRDLDLHWWEPTEMEAIRAAELSTIPNLALGDRFCIALGEVQRALLVTADQEWAKLPLKAPVHLIR